MLLVIHSRADLRYQCSQINSERQTRGLSRLTETSLAITRLCWTHQLVYNDIKQRQKRLRLQQTYER